MRNYFITGLISLIVGLGLGFYIGWIQFPVEYRNSHLCQLDDDYRENYTLMIARGYRRDGDINKALDRLRPLRSEGKPECEGSDSYQIDNVSDWVQRLTVQYITEGASQGEIRDLVALAEGFGRLTPVMESFRSTNPATPQP
jgi:hypothetical protein